MEYKEALETYRKLAKDNPAVFLGDMSTTQTNLAALHLDLDRPAEAEVEFMETLEISRSLAKDNPTKYMSSVADILNNMGYLYASQKDFSKAIEAIDHAIALCQKKQNTMILKSKFC